MNIGPTDRNVAGTASPGAFRASDADRERVIDNLKTAFVLGRLTRDELGLRTGRALEARTYVELAAVTAGILTGPTGARLPPRPVARAPSRRPVVKRAVASGAVAIALSAGVWAAFLTYYGGFLILSLFAFTCAVVFSVPVPSQDGVTNRRLGQ